MSKIQVTTNPQAAMTTAVQDPHVPKPCIVSRKLIFKTKHSSPKLESFAKI